MVDGGAVAVLALRLAVLVLVLIFVLILAFVVSVPRAQPLKTKAITEIATTRIRTGGLMSVFFIITLSAGFAPGRDVNFTGVNREGP